MSSSISLKLVHRARLTAYKRLVLPVLIMALLLHPNTQLTMINMLSDAFWAIAVYVAATLTLMQYLGAKLSRYQQLLVPLKSNPNWQLPVATLLGLLPGCGGAIVVVTQYVQGRMCFAAVVSVLTATMGDAAFLLLAQNPSDGLQVMAICALSALLSGWLVLQLFGSHYLARPLNNQQTNANQNPCRPLLLCWQGRFWQWLLAPTFIIALFLSFQVDLAAALSVPTMTFTYLGAAACLLALSLWACSREVRDYQSYVAEDPPQPEAHPMQHVAQDSHFVLAWAMVALLVVEGCQWVFDLPLQQLLQQSAVWLPLLGVVIGLLPGCGPQLLITSWYLQGSAPMSMLLGNAISNDGDALFPAIALAPKAALLASFYSAIPALVVAYSWHVLFE